jgi:hypothetical protein
LAQCPGVADEACNAKDDDCDGLIDEHPDCPACKKVDANGGGKYAYCFRNKSYAAAEADCVTQGGHLVSIHTQAQQDQIATAIALIADTPWIIGLSDAAKEGTYAWSDGSSLNFQPWADGQPNDGSGNDDCIQLVSPTWKWNDRNCDTELPYVCKLP